VRLLCLRVPYFWLFRDEVKRLLEHGAIGRDVFAFGRFILEGAIGKPGSELHEICPWLMYWYDERELPPLTYPK
jgi:hypothetical protein